MFRPQTQPFLSSGASRRDVLRVGAGAVVLGLATLSHAAANSDEVFLVKPYLQLGDALRLLQDERMVVSWHSVDEDTRWSVEFRKGRRGEWVATTAPQSDRVAVTGIVPHRVYRATLTGLTPGGEFEYRVRRNELVVFTSAGRACKNRSQPVHCVVMGDCGTGSLQQKKVAFQVARTDPDFVLIPGDIVYANGRISEYRQFLFPVYSQEKASPETGEPLLRSVPFLGGLGQHDTGATLDSYADGFAYYMYWSFPLNGPVGDEGSANAFPLGNNEARRAATFAATQDRYPRMANYSFDYGDSHWTVLDSWNPHINWNDPDLREWLRKDLESTDATWKFVSSYLPPFNSSVEYPHTQKMRVIVDILQDTGVDIVFCGYAHSYQVTYRCGLRRPANRTVPFVTPGTRSPARSNWTASSTARRRPGPAAFSTSPRGVAATRVCTAPSRQIIPTHGRPSPPNTMPASTSSPTCGWTGTSWCFVRST